MKTFKIFLIIAFILFCVPCIAEEKSYLDEIENSDYKETKNVSQDNSKNKKETKKYQYDIEIYPYVSIKYTSVNVKEEEILIDNDI